jgi:hypothetical protein
MASASLSIAITLRIPSPGFRIRALYFLSGDLLAAHGMYNLRPVLNCCFGIEFIDLECYSPGRFYASMVVKMMAVHVLTHYEFKLVDEKANPTFAWGTNIVPSPWMRLLIRRQVV